MSALDRKAKITITRNTRGIAVVNFSNVLLLSDTASVGDGIDATTPAREFRGIDEVLAAGFTTSTEEYKAADAFFQQPAHPEVLVIGLADFTDEDSIIDSIVGIQSVSSEWYGISAVPVTQDVAEAISAWAILNKKFYATATSDVENVLNTPYTTDITSVAYHLNSARAEKTTTIFSEYTRKVGESAAAYPDVATLSAILSKKVGKYTLDMLTVSGIKGTNYTDSQVANALDKNVTVVTAALGRVYLEGGRTHEDTTSARRTGEWADTMIGIDWLEVRMQEGITQEFLRHDKIGQTDRDIGYLEASVDLTLSTGVTQNFLASYEITTGAVLDQPEANRQDRKYTGISWTARLEGAVHFVEIGGTVSA